MTTFDNTKLSNALEWDEIIRDKRNWYIFFASTGVVYLAFKIIRNRRYTLPPGPTPLPLLGNLLQLRNSDRLYKVAIDFSKTYNSEIVKVDFGIMGCSVIINGYETLKKALLENLDLVSDRALTFTLDVTTRGGKDVACAPVSETWKRQRKLGYQAFKMIAEGDLISKFCAIAFEKQKNLMIKKQNDLINPRDMIAFGIFNAICNLSYGKEYDLDDEDFIFLNSLNTTFINIVGNGTLQDFFQFLSFLPNRTSKLLVELINKVEKIIMTSFKYHEETYNSNEIRNISDAIVKVRGFNKDGDQYLNDEYVMFLIYDIFVAGTDTSIDILNWMIIYVVRYPEIQNKVYSEIKSVISAGDYPNYFDKNRLPYCLAFMYELLRLASIAPFGLPHKPKFDCKLSGYDIPKEFKVFPNLYAIHRDPKYWENPGEFIPERFIDESGNVSHIRDSYFPFGAGRRVCLGESIARPLLFNFITNLLFTFEFYVPEGSPLPTLCGIENQLRYIPGDDYKISFRLR